MTGSHDESEVIRRLRSAGPERFGPPPLDAIEARGRRIRRRRRTAVVGGVALGVLGVIGAVNALTPGSQSTAPPPVDRPPEPLGAGVMTPDGADRLGPTFVTEVRKGKPTSWVSLLRINENPDATIRDMLTQLSTLLPDANVNPSRARYGCDAGDPDVVTAEDEGAVADQADERVIVGCSYDIRGHTGSGRSLRVRVDVQSAYDTPNGAIPSVNGRPVMRVGVTSPARGRPQNNLEEPMLDRVNAPWPEPIEPSDRGPGESILYPSWTIQDDSRGIAIAGIYGLVTVDPDADVEAVARAYARFATDQPVRDRIVTKTRSTMTRLYVVDSSGGYPSVGVWSYDAPGRDYILLALYGD